jgi:hypothetical protein
MTTKKLSLKYGTNVNYKLIKDGYKTVNGSFVVGNDTPKAMILDAPQEIYTLPNIIDIDTETKSAPIVNLTEDLELPDDTIIKKGEYVLGEYGKEYFIPNDLTGNKTTRLNNFNIVGSNVKLFNNTAMNFASNSFIALKTPFKPGSNSWELVIKIKTPTSMGVLDTLFGSYDSFYKTIGCELGTNNKLGVGITSNGSSWDIAWLSGKTVLSANTWYWIKVCFTGTEYRFELSTDGQEYVLENSVVNSTPIYGGNDSIMNFGKCGWRSDWWRGLIDLSETYIKINNEFFWKPECVNIVKGYSLNGSWAIVGDGIACDFSENNYITLDNTQYSSTDNVTYVFKFNAPSTSLSSSQCVFEQDYFANLEFRYATRDFRAWNWGAGQYEYIMTPELGKTYWFKINVNGQVKTYYWSEDGVNYDNSYTMTDVNINTTSGLMYIGRTAGGSNIYHEGIDIKNSWVEINNVKHCISDICSFVGHWSNNNIMTKFSSSNYISCLGYLPMVFSVLEFHARIIPEQSSAVQCIYDTYWNIALDNMYPRVWCGSQIKGSTQLSANVEYDIKVIVNSDWNTSFYYKRVEDSNWTLATSGVIDASSHLPGAEMCLGIHVENVTEPFLGKIDLNHTYINVDGKNWWKAAFKNIFSSGDFVLYGATQLVNENTMCVFWENMYVKFLQQVNSNSELFFVFRTEKNINELQNLFYVPNPSGNTGPEAYIKDNNLCIWNNYTNSDVILIPVEMSKTYKFKEMLHGTGADIIVYDENDNILYENSFDNLGLGYGSGSFANIGTHSGSTRWFRGRIDFKASYIKTNGIIEYLGKIAGKYLPGIFNVNIEDVTEEKTYNLYDVQTDKRSLILSEDKNLNVDDIEFIEYCGQVTIPTHTVYEYDSKKETWSNLPVTINYSIPEGAIITIDDVIVETSPYITDKIGEIVYKVNKEGYEEYIGHIDHAFGGSTYEITITEDDMISNSSSEGPAISPDTPDLTRQYYAFTPTNNAFLTSANTNGGVNGDTSTFYAVSEEVGTHQVLYMLNPETNNMIEITNVELRITSSSLSVYPLTTGTPFFQPPKQTDAVRNSAKDIVTNVTPEASTTATLSGGSLM